MASGFDGFEGFDGSSAATAAPAAQAPRRSEPTPPHCRDPCDCCEGFGKYGSRAALSWAFWCLVLAVSLFMTILGALILAGGALAPRQHLCNFSVSNITCEKQDVDLYTYTYQPFWPNANIVNGSRCPLYWDPQNDYSSLDDCMTKVYELQQKYYDSGTGTAQLVCWGPEEQFRGWAIPWMYSACFTTPKPAPRSPRTTICWGLLLPGTIMLCVAVCCFGFGVNFCEILGFWDR